MTNNPNPKPLERFDYGLVAPKIVGLYFNLDRDLQRRIDEATERRDADADRCLTLLSVMIRFAWNSYKTVLYIAGDTPPIPQREPNFVLVVPNINRQLLDLLFSLVYMREDFRVRSLAYQKSGWRDMYEEREQFKESFGTDPEWSAYFAMLDSMLDATATRHGITTEERKDPKLVPYWDTPYRMLKKLRKNPTPSLPFIEHMEKWLYKDTSAQAHLQFGGLMKISPFILAELFGKDEVEKVNDRPIKIYHFGQVSRTAISFLAIATEIDSHCNFGNQEAINYIWTMISSYAPEAREMWEIRYRDR